MKLAWLVVLLVAASSQAMAAQVKLKDGSVVYGSITALSEGDDLIVDTAHMDEVTIEWDSVVSLTDVDDVEIEFFNGDRAVGRLSVVGAVAKIEGPDAQEVDPSTIFSVADVKDDWTERLSAYTDFGSNVVRGNNQVSQLSFGGGIGYEDLQHELSLNTTAILNEQIDAPNTRRTTLNANYAYNLPRKWQAVSYYQFEADEQQNLDGRSILGLGAGKRFINNRRHRFDAYAGVAINVERFDLGDQGIDRNESAEGFIGFNYQLRAWADADLGYYIYPSLEEGDRVRTELNASLNFDLFSDLDFKLTFFDRYDSEPPAGNKNNDTGLTMGLSWEY